MTLHIFNPEHDLALAAHLANFTAARAGRALRHDLALLPIIWAEAGDLVLVERNGLQLYYSVTEANKSNLNLLDGGDLDTTMTLEQGKVKDIERIEVWGWDQALRAQLRRLGVEERLLPSDEYLEELRELSHRRTAAQLLKELQTAGTVGEAVTCHSIEEIASFRQQYPNMVLKAPWSSSGRGVRFVHRAEDWTRQRRWAQNVISAQGSIMAEPFYKKEMDLAMEFHVDDDGRICYDGLSIFDTSHGAYTGNTLAPEDIKRKMISHYIPVDLIDSIREKITANLSDHLASFIGPFGVDMMIVEGGLLHPCVEVNLRRTMGHVALALGKQLQHQNRPPYPSMLVGFDGEKYYLKIKKNNTNGNFANSDFAI